MFGARLATVRLVAAFNVLESPVPTELLVEFFLILQYIEWLGQKLRVPEETRRWNSRTKKKKLGGPHSRRP